MNLDEENTHVALADYAKDIIEPKAAAQGGRLIRIKGDGFLAEFDSAINAVRCGLKIQNALANHKTRWPIIMPPFPRIDVFSSASASTLGT
jgi:class 3 adenylate cyclase